MRRTNTHGPAMFLHKVPIKFRLRSDVIIEYYSQLRLCAFKIRPHGSNSLPKQPGPDLCAGRTSPKQNGTPARTAPPARSAKRDRCADPPGQAAAGTLRDLPYYPVLIAFYAHRTGADHWQNHPRHHDAARLPWPRRIWPRPRPCPRVPLARASYIGIVKISGFGLNRDLSQISF